MIDLNMKIVRFCAEEVERQGRGAIQVWDMVVAWMYAAAHDGTPAEAYREFQEIHPFRDGNGRVGKIVFNLLNGTLHDPQMPPNFFNCANP